MHKLKAKILILALTFYCQSYAQVDEFQTEHRARSFLAEKQFDSAAILYSNLLVDAPAYQRPSLLLLLGRSYFYSNNLAKAREALKMCIQMPDTIKRIASMFPQREACLLISEIHASAENYDSAIYYIRLAESKFKYKPVCGTGEFERKMELANTISIYFEKTNQIDSALTWLTPFMFSEPNDLLIDSSEYLTIVDRYTNLVKKRFSRKAVHTLLKQGLAQSFYNHSKNVDQNQNSNRNDIYDLKFSFQFLGATVVLIDMTYPADTWSPETIKLFDRNILLDQLKATPGYRKLTR